MDKRSNIFLVSSVAKEAGSSPEEEPGRKINLQHAKPNLKPLRLFQSSQVGITKLQCFDLICNSSRRVVGGK